METESITETIAWHARKLDRINAVLPGLFVLREQLERDGHVAAGVVLPAGMNPAPGDRSATVMGLPVTWGDRVGLIVGA